MCCGFENRLIQSRSWTLWPSGREASTCANIPLIPYLTIFGGRGVYSSFKSWGRLGNGGRGWYGFFGFVFASTNGDPSGRGNWWRCGRGEGESENMKWIGDHKIRRIREGVVLVRTLLDTVPVQSFFSQKCFASLFSQFFLLLYYFSSWYWFIFLCWLSA